MRLFFNCAKINPIRSGTSCAGWGPRFALFRVQLPRRWRFGIALQPRTMGIVATRTTGRLYSGQCSNAWKRYAVWVGRPDGERYWKPPNMVKFHRGVFDYLDGIVTRGKSYHGIIFRQSNISLPVPAVHVLSRLPRLPKHSRTGPTNRPTKQCWITCPNQKAMTTAVEASHRFAPLLFGVIGFCSGGSTTLTNLEPVGGGLES